MIITVDPSQSEDIAAFAMVKQYRMQALNVTLNGGTGSSAWQAVQGGEGYTQTVVTPVTGIELVYEDPNAIVSYTVENDDTSNYDTASDAGIILSSIEPTDNAWTYTCVFHADSVPVSSVDIDLLVYGNIARGTEQQGSPATAEEITAQVLAGLETRVTALEEEMPDKADVATTYTKTETDTLLGAKVNKLTTEGESAYTHNGTTQGERAISWEVIGSSIPRRDANGYLQSATNTTGTKSNILTTGTRVQNDLDAYAPMVRTTGNQTIAGVKTIEEVDSPTTVRTGMKLISLSAGATEEWYKVYEYIHSGGSAYGDQALTMMASYARRSAGDVAYIDAIGILTVSYRSNYPLMRWIVAGDGVNPANFKISKTYDSTADKTYVYIWAKVDSNTNRWIFQKMMASTLNSPSDNWNVSTDTTAYAEPTSTDWGLVGTSSLAPINGTVTLGTAQTISGAKNFSALVSSSTLEAIRHALPSTATFKLGGDGTTTERWTHLYNRYGSDGVMTDKDATAVAAHTTRRYFGIYAKDDNNTTREIGVSFYNNRGTGYVTAPNRGYDSNNASLYANDIVTFTSLGAYTPMVKTTGDQTIAGGKTFTSNPKVLTGLGGSYIKQVTDFTHNSRPESNTALRLIQLNDSAGNYIGRLNIIVNSDGKTRLSFEGYVIDGDGNRVVKSTDVGTLTP